MTAEEAVDRYSRLVLDLAWRITRSEEDALDIHQDAFLKLSESLRKGKEIRNPKAWLCRTATRDALKKNRYRQRHEPFDDDTTVAKGNGGPAEAELDHLARQIRDHVCDLPERQQEVFVLRLYQGLDYPEICQIVDCAPGAARAALHQGLKKMREWLCEDIESTEAGGR